MLPRVRFLVAVFLLPVILLLLLLVLPLLLLMVLILLVVVPLLAVPEPIPLFLTLMLAVLFALFVSRFSNLG